MTNRRTRTGRILSDGDIDRIADDVARADADPSEVRARKRGRPLAGSAPGEVVAVRMEPSLREALGQFAVGVRSSVSEVVRAAVAERVAPSSLSDLWRPPFGTSDPAVEQPKLPQRSRSHQISTDSETEFRRLVEACGWQFHGAPPQEYGVDGVVEIFDEDGFTTGLRFNVQLKSTDTASWRVRVSPKTFNYWAQLAEPVLLFLFQTQSGEARWQWAGWRSASVNAQSVAFGFEPHQRWDVKGTPDQIVRHVEAVRRLNQPLPSPIPVAFELHTSDITSLELTACIASAAERLGLRLDLRPRRGEGLCKLNIHKDRADVDTGFNPIGMGYESIPLDSLDHWATAVVLTIAGAFAENGRDEALLRVLEVDEYEDFVPRFAIHNLELLLAVVVRRSRPDLAVRISAELRGLQEDAAALDLLVEALRSVEGAAGNADAIAELRALSESSDPNVAGRASYEIGEQTFAAEPERAIEAFVRASEVLPGYAENAQFHQRLGAAHHFAARHEEAIECYRRAQRLDLDVVRDFLIADCLFFAGHFGEARRGFDDALKRAGKGFALAADWILRRVVLEDLLIDGRDFDSAARFAETLGGPEGWRGALELDPLLADAAFNLAIHNRNNGEPSFGLFLRAAVVHGDDAEAWLNALATSVTEGAIGVLPPLVESAIQHCGHQIAHEVRALVADQRDADALMRLVDVWSPVDA